MNDQGKPASNPRGALFTARIIWGAMLLGQIIFLGVVMGIRQEQPPGEDIGAMLGLIALVLVVTVIPVAYFIRATLYGPGRSDGKVDPGRYLSGNIVFLALHEGPSFFGIVAFMLSGQAWPALAATGIAMLVQAANFPTGSAMGMDRI